MNITQMKIHKHVKTNADAFMREKKYIPCSNGPISQQEGKENNTKSSQGSLVDLYLEALSVCFQLW